MYYYMDMPFKDESTAKSTLGSIVMYYRNSDRLGGTVYGGDICLRYYVFMSEDYNKLANITNAIDGSKAIAADTGDVYILCTGAWRLQPKFSETTNGDTALRWSH